MSMSMKRDVLVSFIVDAVRDLADAPPNVAAETVDEQTRLFGPRGILDSIGLVSLIMDLEQQIHDEFGSTVSLADERAFSQSRSPFRSVGSLADYVLERAHDGQ